MVYIRVVDDIINKVIYFYLLFICLYFTPASTSFLFCYNWPQEFMNIPHNIFLFKISKKSK